MATVLITSESFGQYSHEGRRLLMQAGLSVIDNPYGHTLLTPAQIIAYAGQAEAMICDLERIDRSVIDAAPRLRIIARRGVGIDSVDWQYAQSKGIEVARTLHVVEPPVAELVMGYIVELARHISRMSAAMHAGQWARLPSHSVAGGTLGIIGMGNIACEVARRAIAFDMRVVYADVTEQARAKALGAEKMPLEDVLAAADYLTLHVPLTNQTRGMIDRSALARMKPTACLINTARGGVVDVAALADALRAGRLRGAAIDVYDAEPCTDSPLRGMPGVLLTPHIGTYTEEVYARMDVEAARNVVRCLVGPDGA